MQKARVLLAVLTSASVCVGCDLRLHTHASEDNLPPGAMPPASAFTSPMPAANPQPANSVLVSMQPVSFAPIVHVADPSVVTITTLAEEVETSPFTHRRRPQQTGGLGTGFVIDKNGIILTNNHVVEGAKEIQVKLSDGRELSAKVVGSDPPTDIAVVRIDTSDLHPMQLGDSDRIEVGDWVVAIGNPFGLSHTVSAGIVSAKGRTLKDVPLDPTGYYDFLQTDASINPGNSGGPLLNLKGEVVGMNSAIRGGAQGIGFAIPINMIKQLLPVLLRDGRLTRSALGVGIADVRELTKEDRQAFNIAEADKISGAVVEYVQPGGAASRAELKPGDVIRSFDGILIERQEQLQWLASTAGVGRSVVLGVQRAGKPFDVKVSLGQLSSQSTSP